MRVGLPVLLSMQLLLILLLFFRLAIAQTSPSYEKACRAEHGCNCIVRAKVRCCCTGDSIREIPQTLGNDFKILTLKDVGVERIDEHAFANYPQLEEIVVKNATSLTFVDAKAFGKLRSLNRLSITECRNLKDVKGILLVNNTRMFSLIMDNNALTEMPTLRMTELHRFPVQLIDFSHNSIEQIVEWELQSVVADRLLLSHNKLRQIGSFAFEHCQISQLELNDNLELKTMSPDSFTDITHIRSLDLSRTGISILPEKGLSKLETLKLTGTDTLKKLPPIFAFTTLKNVEFTYPYHCCLFKHALREMTLSGEGYKRNLDEIKARRCKEKIDAFSLRMRRHYFRRRRRRSDDNDRSSDGGTPEAFPDFNSLLSLFEKVNDGEFLTEVQTDQEMDLPEFEFPDAEIGLMTNFNCGRIAVSDFFASIQCSPMPNALNPCENVVGYQFLRWAIWFVWISAIIGNIGVWAVLATVRQKRMRVHYFFMANLATADLLTGAYLGMLAIEDVGTADEYYNHAVEWQTGFGCQIAGFISVFASELSILSMFFIAFEMWFNTRYAFYGRRLNELTAYVLMVCAYFFSFLMAILPIIGVSTYTGTSVCLPLSINNLIDRIYVMFGLLFNLSAFLGMTVCYVSIVKMLCNPKQPSRPEDKAIILKMALLIGTDMLCWFPTLFFGFTAAVNVPLISISVAKIFLVLFFPINSFANPFLYVFFTKIVQKKVKPHAVSLLKRISLTNLASVSSEKRCTSINSFYYCSNPSSLRNGETQHLLQTAVSIDSTPRGSNASSYQKTVTSFNEISRRSSPRVSFQDEVMCRCAPKVGSKGKPFTVLRLRVAAIPEVSDISEQSCSDDHERTKLTDRLSVMASQISRRTHHDSVRSMGVDSGRGDSLTSNTSLRDRTAHSDSSLLKNGRGEGRSKTKRTRFAVDGDASPDEGAVVQSVNSFGSIQA